MPGPYSDLLTSLFTKAMNRPRYAIDPEAKHAIWCRRPGETKDIKLANESHHLAAVNAAENAMRTDAYICIAAALERIAQTLEQTAEQTRTNLYLTKGGTSLNIHGIQRIAVLPGIPGPHGEDDTNPRVHIVYTNGQYTNFYFPTLEHAQDFHHELREAIGQENRPCLT